VRQPVLAITGGERRLSVSILLLHAQARVLELAGPGYDPGQLLDEPGGVLDDLLDDVAPVADANSSAQVSQVHDEPVGAEQAKEADVEPVDRAAVVGVGENQLRNTLAYLQAVVQPAQPHFVPGIASLVGIAHRGLGSLYGIPPFLLQVAQHLDGRHEAVPIWPSFGPFL